MACGCPCVTAACRVWHLYTRFTTLLSSQVRSFHVCGYADAECVNTSGRLDRARRTERRRSVPADAGRQHVLCAAPRPLPAGTLRLRPVSCMDRNAYPEQTARSISCNRNSLRQEDPVVCQVDGYVLGYVAL
jgi:hypothetical protein